MAVTPDTGEALVVDDAGMKYRLPSYEGPLDLLLELIRKHEVDIFDIPIAMITDEYLSYMKAMEVLDLGLGGEWLEMAAMLVYIKSKMLLPKEEEPDDEDGPDPREELVRRLLEYQKYKGAADALDERPMLSRDVFTHAPRTAQFTDMLGPPPLRDASISDLVQALKRVVEKSQDEGTWVYEVNSQKLTLRSVILHVAETLSHTPRVDFSELFDGVEVSRHRIITTFLALLEMTRLKMVKLFQSKLKGDRLFVERAVIDIVEVSQELELESGPEFEPEPGAESPSP